MEDNEKFTGFSCLLLGREQSVKAAGFSRQRMRKPACFLHADCQATRTRFFCRQWVELKLISVCFLRYRLSYIITEQCGPNSKEISCLYSFGYVGLNHTFAHTTF